MIRWIESEIGDMVTMHSVPGAYRLPAGMPEGAQLRLVRCEDSIRIVERDGWEWRVNRLNLDGKYEWG